MPVTLAIIAGAAGQAAFGMQAYSSYQQGKFNRDMNRYQASLNKQRAKISTDSAEREAADAAIRRRQLVATGLTAFAANGILLDAAPTSAPNIWEQDQAAELAIEQYDIRRNAQLAAWGYNTQAVIDRSSGDMAYSAGRLGSASALIGGIGSSIQAGAAGYSLGNALSQPADPPPAAAAKK